MKLIPAIDLMDGKPVRLAQGDFDRRTDYGESAADALAMFLIQGAEMTHIVDLDGAKPGEPKQHNLIAALAPLMPVQVAGGMRTAKQALQYLVMVKETLGDAWMNKELFRFGASSLLTDVTLQIAKSYDGNYQSADYFSLS